MDINGNKILIFGNSGSGKSTLAKRLAQQHGLAHLDLDTLAWQPTMPPQRAPLAESKRLIDAFIEQHESWVIEGCYTDLLELAAPQSDCAVYLNLSIDDCIANARGRPWEPHKYASKAEQDANLLMLIDWIKAYETRTDNFSAKAHANFFNFFQASKLEVREFLQL